jgi:cytochrome c oxidase cbb3-type subunit 2
MPGFPWLEERQLDGSDTAAKMRALRIAGVPYTEEDLRGAAEAVAGKTEMQALIAYLQMLGTASRTWSSQ